MDKLNLQSSQGGLNLRDPLDSMPERDCVQLDNIIPDVGADKIRKGYVKVGNDGADRLLSYNVFGNEKVLTATEEKIYNLDLETGNRTELGDSFTSSDWIGAMFTSGAGNVYLISANGFDIPQIFDGTTLGDIGYTIPAGVVLDSPLSFKNRMYFIEKDSFNIYYSESQQIMGTLTKFPVDNFFKKGGKIIYIGSWSQDGGTGSDDQFVIMSSEGEVLLYDGLSPFDSNWTLRGNFQISRPIGKRCATNFGGDLLFITEQGYFPLSQVLNQDRANRVDISDKINDIVKDRDFTKNWEINWFSKEGLFIVNAPTRSTQYDYEQHVLNFKTGGWCRFVGIDSLSWTLIGGDQGDRIFFCNSNGVYEYNIGYTDDGNQIAYYIQKAYSVFGTNSIKQVIRIKPRYSNIGSLVFSKWVGIDFKLGRPTLIQTTPGGNQAVWDEAIWDEDFWTDEFKVNSFKSNNFSRFGDFVSIGLFGRTIEQLEFYSTEIIFKIGDGDV